LGLLPNISFIKANYYRKDNKDDVMSDWWNGKPYIGFEHTR